MKLQNRLHHQGTIIDYREKKFHINQKNPPWQILSILLQFFPPKNNLDFFATFLIGTLLTMVKYFINHDGSRFAIFSFKKRFFVQYWMWP